MKTETCRAHDNNGMIDLVLLVTYHGMPFLKLLTPELVTSTEFDPNDFKYEIIHDVKGKYSPDDNFYFVLGHLNGQYKSMMLASDQIMNLRIKETLRHNSEVIKGLAKAIFDKCVTDYPAAIVPAMYETAPLLN